MKRIGYYGDQTCCLIAWNIALLSAAAIVVDLSLAPAIPGRGVDANRGDWWTFGNDRQHYRTSTTGSCFENDYWIQRGAFRASRHVPGTTTFR